MSRKDELEQARAERWVRCLVGCADCGLLIRWDDFDFNGSGVAYDLTERDTLDLAIPGLGLRPVLAQGVAGRHGVHRCPPFGPGAVELPAEGGAPCGT